MTDNLLRAALNRFNHGSSHPSIAFHIGRSFGENLAWYPDGKMAALDQASG